MEQVENDRVRHRLYHFPTDLVIIMDSYLDFCWFFGGVSSNSIIASSFPPKEFEVLHWRTEGVIRIWLSDNWVADSCPKDRWSSTLTTSEVSWPARDRSDDNRPFKVAVGSKLKVNNRDVWDRNSVEWLCTEITTCNQWGKYSIANGFPNEQTNNRINDFQVKVSAKKIGHHKICTAMLTDPEIMCH